MSDVTKILNAIDAGDPQAASQLLPLVYDELRKLAAQKVAQEKPGQTLQPTDLVHEAYLRLVASPAKSAPGDPRFANRRHFFAAAAEAMRRILAEQARRKQSLKHGGHLTRQELPDLPIASPLPIDELLAIHEVLGTFQKQDPVKAQIVKLHFFLGMTLDEVASVLGLAPATVDRYWDYARTWLKHQLDASTPKYDPPPS